MLCADQVPIESTHSPDARRRRVPYGMNPEIIQHYHAHVYYDPASSRDRAARLRERVAATFPGATLGRWHDTPVGPHTQSMYQVAFPPLLLASFLLWAQSRRSEHLAPPRHRRRLRRSHRPRCLVGQRAAAANECSSKVAEGTAFLNDLRCRAK